MSEYAANPVMQALLSRRSIRKYTTEPIKREDMLAILEAGRWAPSGLNNQPWRFLVLTAGDERKSRLEAATKYGHIVNRAHSLVLVFLAKDKMYHPMKDHQSIGACLQNMLLAAHSLGLGGVWLGEIVNQEAQVLRILGLDASDYAFQAALAFGHPDGAGASSRLELTDILIEDF